MKITNKYNLPEALVDVVKAGLYEPKPDTYSVTTLLNPTRMIALSRRHYDEIEQDANEMMNMVIGSAVHSLIEKMDKTGFAEKYLKYGNITGKCDLYDAEHFELVDYKTATTWKIIHQDFEDWRKQGLAYAWMLIKEGYYVKALKFHAILKDWSPRDARKGGDYPQTQVYTWYHEIDPHELVEIEDYLTGKVKELESFKDLADDDLPDCGKDETWYTGDKYAVYKNANDARAQRVFDTEQEANDYLVNKMAGKGIVVFRQGEYRRCQDYCSACKWCKYYQERKAE